MTKLTLKAAAVMALAVSMTGCDSLSKILGGTEIKDDSTKIEININPPASPSPTPAPTATPLPGGLTVSRVFASMYGEDCPPGVAPANQHRTIRRTCTARLTCTAILSDGRDAGDVFPGSSPNAFAAYDPNPQLPPGAPTTVVRLDGTGEAWNRDAVGQNTGTAGIYCAYGGVDSRTSDGPWILTVLS